MFATSVNEETNALERERERKKKMSRFASVSAFVCRSVSQNHSFRRQVQRALCSGVVFKQTYALKLVVFCLCLFFLQYLFSPGDIVSRSVFLKCKHKRQYPFVWVWLDMNFCNGCYVNQTLNACRLSSLSGIVSERKRLHVCVWRKNKKHQIIFNYESISFLSLFCSFFFFL